MGRHTGSLPSTQLPWSHCLEKEERRVGGRVEGREREREGGETRGEEKIRGRDNKKLLLLHNEYM